MYISLSIPNKHPEAMGNSVKINIGIRRVVCGMTGMYRVYFYIDKKAVEVFLDVKYIFLIET